MGSRGDVGGVTGDMAAVQVSIAAFWEWHHWIFIRRHQDILQLCLWRPKPDVFHKKSGHHQLCVCYRNLAFSRRPQDTSIRICWDHKRIFLSWEVGPSPVVFVATQLGVFKGFSGLFQLRLLRPNLEYLSWEVEPSPALFMAKEPVVLRETSGHFLAGFGATKIVHFSRKVEPFSAVLVETVFYAKSWCFPNHNQVVCSPEPNHRIENWP